MSGESIDFFYRIASIIIKVVTLNSFNNNVQFEILLQLSDTGLYTCVATSSSGETSWSAYLDVRGLLQQKL